MGAVVERMKEGGRGGGRCVVGLHAGPHMGIRTTDDQEEGPREDAVKVADWQTGPRMPVDGFVPRLPPGPHLAMACSNSRLVPNWVAVIGAMLQQLICTRRARLRARARLQGKPAA